MTSGTPLIKVEEGDCFALPLSGGGFARGVVARQPPRSPVMLAYFFPPRLATLRDALIDGQLTLGKQVLIERCGNGSIKNGHWPTLGKLPSFDRLAWPIPLFISGNTANQLLRVAVVSERDLLTEESSTMELPSAVRGYPDVVGGMTAPEWSVEHAIQSGDGSVGSSPAGVGWKL